MNRRTTLATALVLATGLALAGCSASDGQDGGEPDLKVSGAYIPQPVTDGMAGGFLVISNHGDGADRLTGVSSDIADDVTIHKTENQRMVEVSSFAIPAHGELVLERGGNHIMFMDLKKKPLEGEKVSVELRFEKADPIEVDVPVKEATYNPKQD
ncbi:copper chaperone PCu(A)C [Streptomyces sp. GC420]|uniref:copper chaperone PCu(A)C n=1 Tax=Streptomyces sp. GC420 TaxID=2697568 RepID=UPI0014152BCD|nr:copper chaperone PCu(A)C [Streptomyces sp. GC420]NBM20309.1 copper chaperone PCu(A)C [Streptomyces sp. GC420]